MKEIKDKIERQMNRIRIVAIGGVCLAIQNIGITLSQP
jgi:hypothetical protein